MENDQKNHNNNDLVRLENQFIDKHDDLINLGDEIKIDLDWNDNDNVHHIVVEMEEDHIDWQYDLFFEDV